MENYIEKELIKLRKRRHILNILLEKDKDFFQQIEYKNSCPVCGYPTLKKRSDKEICLICNWKDLGQDDHNAYEIIEESSFNMSLFDYRKEFFSKKKKLIQNHKKSNQMLINLLNKLDEIELNLPRDIHLIVEYLRKFQLLKKIFLKNRTWPFSNKNLDS